MKKYNKNRKFRFSSNTKQIIKRILQSYDKSLLTRIGTTTLFMSVSSSASAFSSPLELSSLLNNGNPNGFVINGVLPLDFSGSSVSSVGDFNGDGIDDFIIGSPRNYFENVSDVGRCHMVFGRMAGFESPLQLSSLNGANGFHIFGTSVNDRCGLPVSSAGDVNGDGFNDVIIGAFWADHNNKLDAGQSYVIFGTNGGFSSSFQLSSLNGANGFAINGIFPEHLSGKSVSGAGDVNGDGYDDVIIGSWPDDNGPLSAGRSYVIFGASNFMPTLELSNLNGVNGFTINGIAVADFAGSKVSGAGDVNGDGFDDIIIGAYLADPNGKYSGQSYVVFGTNSFMPTLELLNLNGTNGFTMNGIALIDHAGRSVSGAGDVNGDGYDDIIIGAVQALPNGNKPGQSYVVFGTNHFAASLEFSSLNGVNGFVINGILPFDYCGISVSGAGDVNGDGFDDVIIGADSAHPNGKKYAGQSYVVFGKNGGFGSLFQLSSLNGANGFMINGVSSFDYCGISVSGAGDVNGDGVDDVIIGAAGADPNGSKSGQSYVIYGQAPMVGDADGDGQMDLFLQAQRRVYAALMTNGYYKGINKALINLPTVDEKVVAVNDFDLDGVTDLATQTGTLVQLRKGPAYGVISSFSLPGALNSNFVYHIIGSGNTHGTETKGKQGYPELIIVRSANPPSGTNYYYCLNKGNWAFNGAQLAYKNTNSISIVGVGRFIPNKTEINHSSDLILHPKGSTDIYGMQINLPTNVVVQLMSLPLFSTEILGAGNFQLASGSYELIWARTNSTPWPVYLGNKFSGYGLNSSIGERVVGPK